MTMDGHGLLSNARSPRLYHQRRVLLPTSKVEQYLRVLLNTSKAEQYLLNVTLDHSPTPTITDRWTNFVQVLHLFAWSTVQHSGTEQNRREESTCLPRGQQVHETATRGKFLSRRPPVSPSSYYHHLRPLGGDLFTLGIFLASIKIVV